MMSSTNPATSKASYIGGCIDAVRDKDAMNRTRLVSSLLRDSLTLTPGHGINVPSSPARDQSVPKDLKEQNGALPDRYFPVHQNVQEQEVPRHHLHRGINDVKVNRRILRRPPPLGN